MENIFNIYIKKFVSKLQSLKHGDSCVYEELGIP